MMIISPFAGGMDVMNIRRMPDGRSADFKGLQAKRGCTKALSKRAAWAVFCLIGGCATGPYPQGLGASGAETISTLINESAEAGVYFSPPSSTESRKTQFRLSVDPGPVRRQYFTDQINLVASTPSRELPVIAQAVGAERRVLVLTMVGAGSAPTPYLARAILARATSVIRSAPILAEMGISQDFDIYNVAVVLGFERIVVSDARAFTHEVHLVSEE